MIVSNLETDKEGARWRVDEVDIMDFVDEVDRAQESTKIGACPPRPQSPLCPLKSRSLRSLVAFDGAVDGPLVLALFERCALVVVLFAADACDFDFGVSVFKVDGKGDEGEPFLLGDLSKF